MTEVQAIELVAQRFKAQWPGLSQAVTNISGGVPFVLENEALPSADSFALLMWQPLASQTMTMGPHPRFERHGLIWVKLWTPANTGAAGAAGLADAARQIFEGQALSPGDGSEALVVYAGNTQKAGIDARWFISAVQFEAVYYEQT